MLYQNVTEMVTGLYKIVNFYTCNCKNNEQKKQAFTTIYNIINNLPLKQFIKEDTCTRNILRLQEIILENLQQLEK